MKKLTEMNELLLRTKLLLTSGTMIVLCLFLSGCGGSEPEPTATPTKTPTTGQAAAPTATPQPAPVIPTPDDPAEESPPAADEPAPAVAVVSADLLNVRSTPDISGAIQREIRRDERYDIVGRSEDGAWLQIAQNGQALGWVAAEFVAVEGAVNGSKDAEATTPPAATDNAAQPTTPPTSPVTFLDSSMNSPDYGAQAFLWWREEIADRDLTLMKEADFRWVKQTFAWETIEGAGKGQYDWSIADRVVRQVNEHGIKLLARVSTDPETNFWAGPPPGNGDNFAQFVGTLAARYNCQPGAVGCIQAYQIWNEPNLAREWGGQRPNPAQYVDFLRKAYAAIKAANPNAVVINAGMAPTGSNDNNAMPDDIFYDQMYQAMGGSSNGYFDMLGVHGAGFAAPPELDPAEAAANPQYGGYRFFAFRHVEDIRAIMVKYGDTNKRVVLLEFGWTFDPVNPDYKWHGADAGIDALKQAQYLAGAYEWAKKNWQPWIGLMNLLTMPNIDWLEDGNPQDEEQYWWAIMDPAQVNEFKPRAAYVTLCLYFHEQTNTECKYDPTK